jgi:hypothetical protein
MVVTNYGKEMVAYRIGSNTTLPGYMAVGSGSGTVAITNIELVNEWDKNATSASFPVTQESVFTADWSAQEASGLVLQEFGLYHAETAETGSLWDREFVVSTTFTGTRDLQIELILQTT